MKKTYQNIIFLQGSLSFLSSQKKRKIITTSVDDCVILNLRYQQNKHMEK